jgi:hypothetical protein
MRKPAIKCERYLNPFCSAVRKAARLRHEATQDGDMSEVALNQSQQGAPAGKGTPANASAGSNSRRNSRQHEKSHLGFALRLALMSFIS